MLTDKVAQALNDQMHRELYAAYLYLSMSGYCDRANLPGIAAWLRNHTQVELGHYQKLFEFLMSTGEEVKFEALNGPPNDFASVLDVFEQFLDHEERGTASFQRLHKLIGEEGCFQVQPLVGWFLQAHVAEESEGRRIVNRLKMIGNDNAALLMLDKQMAGGNP